MIRSLPQLEFDAERLVALCNRWQVAELAVFGSAARGQLRPDSDIDLMVQLRPGAPWGIKQFLGLKDELEDVFGRRVDLVRRGVIKNPFRLKTIERDLVVLYAA